MRSKRIAVFPSLADEHASACSALLNAVDFSVMVVEEAAEIQEAHVVAALQPGLQRVIMIGDHLQLPPKVNSYALTVRVAGQFVGWIELKCLFRDYYMYTT